MRLICGVLHLDGTSASKALLERMAAQMDVPRLQPARRIWLEGPVGLAVVDFGARNLPAAPVPEQGSAVMAADVRLDEPAEVRRTVGAAADASEDVTLLAHIEKFGPRGLDRILGDFAFAHWDRAGRRLICGRDAFGVRPFVYAHRPGKLFAFASFPKALHGSGIVAKIVDEDAVARRMVHAFRADDCLIAGIKRLPPAHLIEVSRDGVSCERYWHLDRANVGTARCPPEEAARELRRLVDQAVACRLPRGETGAHLSGGLDSSAIAVLAARRLREDGRSLHAYSFLDRPRNDITLEDETEFVRAVLEQEGDIDWTPIRPPAAWSGSGEPIDADKMTWLGEDDPENAVCARAESQEVGLILSGWGGDEGATFNGRGAFAELFLRGRWGKLAGEIAALRRERGWSAPRVLYGEVAAYLVPDAAIDLAKRIVGRGANLRQSLGQTLSSDARRRLAAAGDEGLNMAPDGRENRWRLMTSPHIAERAEVWAQTGARHGLAFAFPLLDRRVVEYSLSLPSDLCLRDGYRRRPFRDATTDILPERVRLRHEKYMPFPGRLLDLADSKEEFIARLDQYEQVEQVRRVIDLAHLRRLVAAFPSPEQAREEMRHGDNPAAIAEMITVAQALAAAEYLRQHGG
jgi:asparagine synthase (glutamine-hydrolysing)